MNSRFQYLNVNGDVVDPNGTSSAPANNLSPIPPAPLPVPANITVGSATPNSKTTQYAIWGTATGALVGILFGKNIFHSAIAGLAVGAATGFFLGNNPTVTNPIDAAIAEGNVAIAKGEALSQPLVDKLKGYYTSLTSSAPTPSTVAQANNIKTVLTNGGAVQTVTATINTPIGNGNQM